jgi:hypothetical protein
MPLPAADKFRPTAPVPPLGDFDNYEIYSLVAACLDSATVTGYQRQEFQENWSNTDTRDTTVPLAAAYAASVGNSDRPRAAEAYTIIYASGGVAALYFPSFAFQDGREVSPAGAFTSPAPPSLRRLYAVQTFHPAGAVDFSALQAAMDGYPLRTGEGFRAFTGFHTPAIVEWFAPVSPFCWENLAVNGRIKYRGIAATSGVLTYSYWARNPMEGHPLLDMTVDYRMESVQLIKGKPFVISLHYPIAQTLKFNKPALIAGVSFNVIKDTITGDKPNGLGEYLAGSTSYAESIRGNYPPPPLLPVPTLPPFNDRFTFVYWAKPFYSQPGVGEPLGVGNGGTELQLDGAVVDYNHPATGSKENIPAGPLIYQQIAAGNNCWNNAGAGLPYPPLTAPLPPLPDGVTVESLHFAPQPNNNYGSIVMDSPRTLEIYEQVQIIFRALNAGRYGEKDTATDQYPVINYSLLMEKIAALLGHRPDIVTGEHSIEKEQKSVRQLMPPGADLNKQEYGGKYFGKKAMLMKRLPNQFGRDGTIAAGGVVAVHDIPQLMLEILDQLAISGGIQESGAIEIKDGATTRRYPNQLELMKDIALTASGTHQLAHQAFISSLVTQKQTAEIIGGLGLPTISRSINAVLNNKLEQVPYWGISPQFSIARKIDTVGYNVGVVLGQVI